MSNKLQSIRGMHDILPADTAAWQRLEAVLMRLMASYGYQEIRTPVLERTELFARSIGDVTDIVEKEMYTFEDRNGDSLSLRPEGTAGCVRAGIEHGLLHNQTVRLWYIGTMYRHERPQKGRYREFRQIGVEAFGMAGPDIDAELIMMTARLWSMLGLKNVRLEINSLGSGEERSAYRRALTGFFGQHKDRLDEDSLKRLDKNPLRILDSKNPELKPLIAAAPAFSEFMGAESRAHFDGLRRLLDQAGIVHEVNPRLVRGLDYYNLTVFEWITGDLGAQGTVCAGGRYDGLVEQLGGSPTPAIGFAIGLERLSALIGQQNSGPSELAPDIYVLNATAAGEGAGLVLAEELRNAMPERSIVYHCGSAGLKNQLKRADRSGAHLAVIIGDEELAAGEVTIKPLRGQEQRRIGRSELVKALQSYFE
ncbi:MAG TPA: histidine--tRNA ligase [Gammaproteobacteria bacterium]|nr:histidine--tRNA ligase [Gammaproteobacteria bacterium]